MTARARKALAFGAAAGLVAMTATWLTTPWEGEANKAYWDRLGRVWSICYGETNGVHAGMTMTDAECNRQLYKRLEHDFHRPLQKCISGFDRLPLGLQGSMLDVAYNLGAPTICKSTAARRARAGDYKGACMATTWFDKAGGKVREGLVRRRTYGDSERLGELELCLESLK